MTRIPGFPRHLYPPGWNAISRRIKAQDGWRCKGCGATGSTPDLYLTVHHIDLNPQNSEDDNLITLCNDCHNRVHGMLKQPRTRLEVIQRLKTPDRPTYLRF